MAAGAFEVLIVFIRKFLAFIDKMIRLIIALRGQVLSIDSSIYYIHDSIFNVLSCCDLPSILRILTNLTRRAYVSKYF